MDQSTLVPKGAGEPNLTPGEQRILSLMERGQRRVEQRMEHMEQRMHSMEEKLTQQIKELALKVEYEASASKMRDRQLAEDIQRLRDDAREREARLMEYVNRELGTFQKSVSERFAQHNTRLEVLEQTVQLNCELLRKNTQAIQELQQEMRKLAVALETPAENRARVQTT